MPYHFLITLMTNSLPTYLAGVTIIHLSLNLAEYPLILESIAKSSWTRIIADLLLLLLFSLLL